MSKENEKTLTLEERFAHLEQIVARMEDADVSLDEAFELYKKGLDEVKSANDMVQGMEKAMLVLNGDGQLEEF
ncbi:exodeoxyribonuclease VII small subunit [Agathobacter rectalis]|uniref:exodeoxyribonuclease VII small subunit n=1 Tax=Agathobacter rectalis TaxID=39491 RepID=UPI0027D2ACEE|nr:exodeoxyribonuclease VII small subunit [Agathobacter rectalis]